MKRNLINFKRFHKSESNRLRGIGVKSPPPSRYERFPTFFCARAPAAVHENDWKSIENHVNLLIFSRLIFRLSSLRAFPWVFHLHCTHTSHSYPKTWLFTTTLCLSEMKRKVNKRKKKTSSFFHFPTQTAQNGAWLIVSSPKKKILSFYHAYKFAILPQHFIIIRLATTLRIERERNLFSSSSGRRARAMISHTIERLCNRLSPSSSVDCCHTSSQHIHTRDGGIIEPNRDESERDWIDNSRKKSKHSTFVFDFVAAVVLLPLCCCSTVAAAARNENDNVPRPIRRCCATMSWQRLRVHASFAAAFWCCFVSAMKSEIKDFRFNFSSRALAALSSGVVGGCFKV